MKHDKPESKARKLGRGKPVYWELLGSVLGKRDREPGCETAALRKKKKKSNFGNFKEKQKREK